MQKYTAIYRTSRYHQLQVDRPWSSISLLWSKSLREPGRWNDRCLSPRPLCRWWIWSEQFKL